MTKISAQFLISGQFQKHLWNFRNIMNFRTTGTPELTLHQGFTWNGFSPVCTSWCRLSFELSTNDLPHSAHMCTRGPCVCRCLRIAALSRNNLLQPCTISSTVLPVQLTHNAPLSPIHTTHLDGPGVILDTHLDGPSVEVTGTHYLYKWDISMDQ